MPTYLQVDSVRSRCEICLGIVTTSIFGGLGKTSCVTGDLGYVERARELVLDWIDCNPPLNGVNWTSALETSHPIDFLDTHARITCDWSGWTEADEYKNLQSLAHHADYLANHLSYYSSPYKHLIGEATAYILSVVH